MRIGDPIKYFSKYQAAFIQKSDLEKKIYTFTCSVLLSGMAYLASSARPSNLANIEPYKAAATQWIVSWLFLSTIAGYFLQNEN